MIDFLFFMVSGSHMEFFGRKQIAQLVFVLLLGAQLALAQHATVHLTPEGHAGFHVEHGSNNNGHGGDHNKPRSDRFCQICIFAKSFSQALLGAPAFVPESAFKLAFVFPPPQDMRVQALTRAYQPRAPPVFLI